MLLFVTLSGSRGMLSRVNIFRDRTDFARHQDVQISTCLEFPGTSIDTRTRSVVPGSPEHLRKFVTILSNKSNAWQHRHMSYVSIYPHFLQTTTKLYICYFLTIPAACIQMLHVSFSAVGYRDMKHIFRVSSFLL